MSHPHGAFSSEHPPDEPLRRTAKSAAEKPAEESAESPATRLVRCLRARPFARDARKRVGRRAAEPEGGLPRTECGVLRRFLRRRSECDW